jgi:hypothetical protein
MTFPLRFAGLVAIALALVTGCATPIAPTGGPTDTTPPALVASVPAADSVNVRTDRLVLTFSKPIDATSLRRAITIAPDFDRPLDVQVRGRSADILFPDTLRTNTTYVVTLGTELRDLRNNRLAAPITLAFATGPQLDAGRIAGVIRDPETAAGIGDMDIFAYALPAGADTLSEAAVAALLPDPRTSRPDYRTQSDRQGRFELEYLRDVPFFVVAVEDRNRNRRADPGEAFAVPPRPAVAPSTPGGEASVPSLEMFVTRVDTLAPEPLRVRAQSRQRFALRFTEPVRLLDRDPAVFALVDSVTQAPVAISAIFPDEDPFQVVVRTAPMQPAPHHITIARPEAVVDTAGNPVRPRALTFTAPATTDDQPLRFLGFEPAGRDTVATIPPGRLPVLRFSEPPAPDVLAARVAARTLTDQPLQFATESDDGVRIRVRVDTPRAFRLLVREPDSLHVQGFGPFPADSLGALEGVVADAPPDEPLVVEVHPSRMDVVRVVATSEGRFTVGGLPGGEARLRFFVDRNGSGEWDGGQLAPYRAPEPLRILPPVRVRPRWDTELDPIRLEDPSVPPAAPQRERPEQRDEPADQIDLGRIRGGPGR